MNRVDVTCDCKKIRCLLLLWCFFAAARHGAVVAQQHSGCGTVAQLFTEVRRVQPACCTKLDRIPALLSELDRIGSVAELLARAVAANVTWHNTWNGATVEQMMACLNATGDWPERTGLDNSDACALGTRDYVMRPT
eukprot:SAG31_NODE_26216_length_446_cov_0.804035_1_plen_136_part_10